MDPQATQQAVPGKSAHWVRTELPQIVLMLALLAATRDSFANHYFVPSGSMEHTLEIGDRVVVDMRAYGLRLPFTDVELIGTGAPASGDIAVFDSPEDGERLIKRVVAVAGDEVELSDGRLSINDVSLASNEYKDTELFRHHRATLNLTHGGGPDIHPLRIPAGQVLMLGDARGNSYDGRFFGLVPASELYGRAVAVYYRRGEGFGWNKLGIGQDASNAAHLHPRMLRLRIPPSSPQDRWRRNVCLESPAGDDRSGYRIACLAVGGADDEPPRPCRCGNAG